MTFHFFFSCFSLVNLLSGNSSTCGSKFLRMQHFVKFHAQTFLESRSSSKLKDCTISEKIYVTWLRVFFQSSAITQIWFKIMKFHSLFSCFSLVNILSGNPETCGSKFWRMQLFERESHVAGCMPWYSRNPYLLQPSLTFG